MKTAESMKTHYDILDVPPSASTDQIRRAFRSLAFIYHPDLAGPDVSDPNLFIQIREAYEVLIDEDRRKAYDMEIEEQRRGVGTQKPERVVDVERPRARQAYSPFYSAQRLVRPVDAEIVDRDEVNLRACDISGSIEISLEETIRPSTFTIILPSNLGTSASGRILIRLPGKIHRDAILRVPRQGLPGNQERGDLFIEVVFAEHPDFRVCADSLFYDLTVQPWQAALGFEVNIPTLEDFEHVTIPPLTSTPSIRRLPGKGIYKRNGERGDLWINLKLEVPPPTTFRARRLWAELAEEYRFSSRHQ